VFFNAGCNEQVLLPNPEKKFSANPSCVFEKSAKADELRCTPIPEKGRHRAEG